MQSIFSPLEQLYKFLYLSVYDITGDYGIALILLSLFIYIILFPFNQKAQQIQNAEREVQSIIAPQIEEIKRQFHGKEQYEKIQRLYHRYAYHPIYAIRSAAGIVLQIPFFVAARSMLYALPDIKGVQWGIIQDLGKPDQLLAGINLLPFVMTFVTVLYAFVMPKLTKKEITQTVIIGFIFLIILYPAPSALLIFWTWNLLWSLLHCLFFDRLQWFNEYIERVRDFVAENELAFHIIFALALTVGLLVPTEVYIKNASQLWFDYKDILKFFITDIAKYFVVLLFIYVICWRKKIRAIYLSLLLGILLGVFLQSYIISLDYGLFDGHEIEWVKFTKAGLVNTFIWLVCLGEAFINFKRMNFNTEIIKKFVKPITIGIIAIQCAVLLITLKNNPIQKDILYEGGNAGILTTKDIYTVSEKDNIIIFLLDAFDASVFEEIQKKNPEVINDLKDFTYFPDTTSSYGFTHFSLPEILTGKLYVPSYSYSKYLYEAWNGNPYYEMLKEKAYSVNLYTSGNYVDKKAPINNLIVERIVLTRNMADSFKNLVMFRIAPHYLKKLYYQYQPGAFNAMVFNGNIKTYEEDDRAFFNGLKKGLRLSNKNIFQFYHLTGMHYPYVLDENVELIKDGEKGTAYKQALGSLKIVKEYIAQMKKYNIYNKAMFAIIADHGYHNEIGGRPIFLIKQSQSENKALVVNNRPTVVAELMPMLFPQVLNMTEDVFEGGGKKNRLFYYENEEKHGHFVKYLINGDAADLNSWIALGEIEKVFYSNKSYNIGDKIDFTIYGDSAKYKTFGWGDMVWTYGSLITQNEAGVTLQTNSTIGEKKDLVIKIICNPLLEFFGASEKIPYRDMKLIINDIIVGSWHFNDKNTFNVSCKIPKGVIKQKDVYVKFVFENPPGVSQPVRFQISEMQILEDD